MNRQLVQDIIKAGNKAIETVSIRYTVDTEDNRYYCYDGLYYDDNHIKFNDDYDDDYDYEYKETEELKFAYLEVPVLFKYAIQTGNMYITPFIGPSLSIAMSGKVSYDSYQYYQNYEEEDSGSMDIKNQMEDIDFGLNFGTDLYFSEKIFLQLKYDLGLSKIFTKSVLESKNRVLSLSMGVSF